jgi:hypothetical protein
LACIFGFNNDVIQEDTVSKKRHSVVLILISALLFIAVSTASADTIVGSLLTPLSVYGSLSFDWQGNVNSSGSFTLYQPLSLILAPTPIPIGATLTSATLQVIVDPSDTVPVNFSRSESDYTYVSGQTPIYQWVCFQHNWLGTCTSSGYVVVGYSPVYSTGRGGYANFTADSYTNINTISTSTKSVSVCCGGTYDLLAMGFGSDLVDGNPFVIDATTFLGIQYGIFDSGYMATTDYTADASRVSSISGILTFDYTTPVITTDVDPVPEPASLALFGLGLTMVAGRLKKK